MKNVSPLHHSHKKGSQVGYKNTDDIMHIFEFGMNEF